jgi:dihydroflavonol-4-reductase
MQFDATASLAELGLKPRPVKESIAEAVAWYREMGWLPALSAPLARAPANRLE